MLYLIVVLLICLIIQVQRKDKKTSNLERELSNKDRKIKGLTESIKYLNDKANNAEASFNAATSALQRYREENNAQDRIIQRNNLKIDALQKETRNQAETIRELNRKSKKKVSSIPVRKKI